MADASSFLKNFIHGIMESRAFDVLDDGVSIQDRDFEILYQNTEQKKEFGDHIGEYCYRAYAEINEICKNCPLVPVFKEGSVHTSEWSVHHEKESRYFEVKSSAIKDSTGTVVAGIQLLRNVSARKKLSEAAHASDEKFRILVENAPIGIYYNDFEGVFHYGNKKAEEIIGYTKEELLGKSFLKLRLLPPNELVKAAKLLALNTLGKETGPVTFTLNRKDGTRATVDINTALITVRGKRRVMGMVQDITERKKIEAALRESEKRFRLLSEVAFDGIAITEKGTFLEVNEEFANIFGYAPDEIVGEHVSKLVAPDRLEDVLEKMDSRYDRPYVTTGVKKDGGQVYFEVCGKSFSYEDRSLRITAIRDITVRKHTEEAILNIAKGVSAAVGEDFFHTMTKHLSYTLEADYAYIAEIVPEKQNIVRTVSMIADDKIIDNIEVNLDGTSSEIVMEGETCSYPDGIGNLFPEAVMMAKMKVQSYVGVPLLSSSGEKRGLMAVMYRNKIINPQKVKSMLQIFATRASAEIERKQAEGALKKSESRLAESQHIAHIGSWEYNVSEDKLWWSDEVYRIFGLNPRDGEITYEEYISRIHPDDRIILEEQIRAGLPYRLDYRISRPDGESRCIHEEVRMTKDRDGIPELIWGTAQDITGRKKLEEKLHAAAITDDLTGLFNRRGFLTLAGQQCKLAARAERGLSLLYTDLDEMKEINDKFGHKIGDQALLDTTHILKKTFRESDIIARIGGGEFAVLLSEPSEHSIGDIIKNHIQRNVLIHNDHAGRDYELKLSIGVSHFEPEHPCSIDELMTRADRKMYEDKRRRKMIKIREKRAFKRYTIQNGIEANLDNMSIANIKDLSLGGACLTSHHHLIPKSIHDLRLRVPDEKKHRLSGMVIWTYPVEKRYPATDRKNLYEAGLKFIWLRGIEKSFLEKITGKFSS